PGSSSAGRRRRDSSARPRPPIGPSWSRPARQTERRRKPRRPRAQNNPAPCAARRGPERPAIKEPPPESAPPGPAAPAWPRLCLVPAVRGSRPRRPC
ncbi:unnamed protein product, partial [Gulo gulo]